MKKLYFFLRAIYYSYVVLLRKFYAPKIYVFNYQHEGGISVVDLEKEMLFFFGESKNIYSLTSFGVINKFIKLLTGATVITIGKRYNELDRIWFNVFNVDTKLCHVAAWSWHRLLSFYFLEKIQETIDSKKAYQKFLPIKAKLAHYQKCYVFGTGPSLIHCMDCDFSDGIRIACNTIVKSDKIWGHVKPQFVVAGDAIHHFSAADYACNFRKDLKRRLLEDDSLIFMYPSDFYVFVSREFSDFERQLIPMGNSGNEDPFKLFTGKIVKAANENVLTMLQIPLAANLSNCIYFLGFDGRGKNDTGFWKSSDEYNYIDDMPQMREYYPAFFYYYLEMNKDKDSYVKKVHGNALEHAMQEAEKRGYFLYSLAPSNTPTFQKRYENFMALKTTEIRE